MIEDKSNMNNDKPSMDLDELAKALKAFQGIFIKDGNIVTAEILNKYGDMVREIHDQNKHGHNTIHHYCGMNADEYSELLIQGDGGIIYGEVHIKSKKTGRLNIFIIKTTGNENEPGTKLYNELLKVGGLNGCLAEADYHKSYVYKNGDSGNNGDNEHVGDKDNGDKANE